MYKQDLCLFICLLFCMTASAFDIEDYRLVDLSHTYDDQTLYWPTSPTSFELEQLDYGVNEAGYFYSAYSCFTS